MIVKSHFPQSSPRAREVQLPKRDSKLIPFPRGNSRVCSRQEACQLLKTVNPAFAEQLQNLTLTKELPIVLANYAYGDELFNHSRFNLPKQSKEVKKLESHFKMMPMAVVLNKSVETYLAIDERVIPTNIAKKGDIIGLDGKDWGAYHHATAGARSLFMLPRIAEELSHRRLKRYVNVRSDVPKTMWAEHETFKEIASDPEFGDNWQAQVLLFPRQWLEQEHEPAWQEFYCYLHSMQQQQQAYWQQQKYIQMVYSSIFKRKNMVRLERNQSDTIQQLIAIVANALPGFRIATNDECAPISALSAVYNDIYQIKTYHASFVEPCFIGQQGVGDPLYYSLRVPTVLEEAPRLRSNINIMSEIRQLNTALQGLQYALDTFPEDYQHTQLANLLEGIEFNCFHFEQDQLQEVARSTDILPEDKAVSILKDRYPMAFCETSAFFKGCVRIRKQS